VTPFISNSDGASESAGRRSLLGPIGILISFLWGLAEATFFFVVPDVILSLAAILGGRRTWPHILAAISGAFLGGALLFQWAQAAPPQAHAAVARVPFIRQSMFTKVEDGLRTQGLSAVFFGSISGIPYKLYAVEAPKFFSERDFLLATPPVRAVRFLVVWLVFGGVAAWLRTRLHWPTLRLLCVYAIVWIATYAFYWGRIVLH
jgi:membrane protein YqaA with SNARE-associated domain